MMSDSTQPWAAPEDRPSAQRFLPLPSGGAAAPAFFERCWVSLVPGRRSASPSLRIDGTESRASIFLPRDGALLLRLPQRMWAYSVSASISPNALFSAYFLFPQYDAKLLTVQLDGGEYDGSRCTRTSRCIPGRRSGQGRRCDFLLLHRRR